MLVNALGRVIKQTYDSLVYPYCCITRKINKIHLL